MLSPLEGYHDILILLMIMTWFLRSEVAEVDSYARTMIVKDKKAVMGLG